VTPVERVGRSAIRCAEDVGTLALQSWHVTLRLPRVGPVIGRRRRWRTTVQQMLTIGADALPMAAIMSFCIGYVLALQSAAELRRFGAVQFVVDLLAISFTRELGALITALAVSGRTGEIEYDNLIVATGARQSYFESPEFADDAPGMKTLDDALELCGRIFGAFEMAEYEADPAARRRWLTFLIVGAGPTGVELAGQLGSRRSLRGHFRRIDPGEAHVLLLGAASTILPAYPEALRERAARDLRELGVETTNVAPTKRRYLM
jgi:hypothetical protein